VSVRDVRWRVAEFTSCCHMCLELDLGHQWEYCTALDRLVCVCVRAGVWVCAHINVHTPILCIKAF